MPLLEWLSAKRNELISQLARGKRKKRNGLIVNFFSFFVLSYPLSLKGIEYKIKSSLRETNSFTVYLSYYISSVILGSKKKKKLDPQMDFCSRCVGMRLRPPFILAHSILFLPLGASQNWVV